MKTKHHRRSIRLCEADYSVPGMYFVTICVKNRECLFGEVVGGEMRLSEYGEATREGLLDVPNHRPNVIIDEYVIMPNHIHTIIEIIDGRGMACHAPALDNVNNRGLASQTPTRQFANPIAGSLATIIGSFKSAVTKQINIIRQSPSDAVWQRNYYEHIIRNDKSLNQIRQYIRDNPFNWSIDENNPVCLRIK